MSALDDKIDDLYRQPLAGFTAARNALAKTLSGEDAKRVKALPKPTVVAWAANQLYWHARRAYDALMKSGADMRKAQIAALQGKAADLRSASEDHRRAVAAAVAEAERLASSAGSSPSADALTRTFEALSLTPHPPDPPGRLAEALQPAGFEALAGITPAGAGKPVRVDHGPAEAGHYKEDEGRTRAKHDGEGRTRAKHDGGGRTRATYDGGSVRVQPDRGRGRERQEARRAAAEAQREAEEARAAAAARRQREAELRKADAVVARAEASEKLARAAWERAHDALLEARRKRDEIKKPRG